MPALAARNRLTYSDFCTQLHQHPEKVAKKVTFLFISFARYLIIKQTNTQNNRVMITSYTHRKQTAKQIGLEYAALPILQELYCENRITNDTTSAAYYLANYRYSRSQFVKNVQIRLMEQEYFSLQY